MILRQALNFAVHAAAGFAVGALVVITAKALMDQRRREMDATPPIEPLAPSMEPPLRDPASP